MANEKSIEKKSISVNIAEFILKYYFLWGMFFAVTLRFFKVYRSYYTLIGATAFFVLLYLITNRTLYLKEFLWEHKLLSFTACMCLLYQMFVLRLAFHTIARGLLLYILIFTGFLYGKKYKDSFGKVLHVATVPLAVTSIFGTIWWALWIFPLESISVDAARFFYELPGRMVSVYVHPILAGFFMLFLVCIALFSGPFIKETGDVALDEKRRKIDTGIRFVMAFIGIAGVYSSLTRSAYLVLAVMLIIWATGNKNPLKRIRKQRKKAMKKSTSITVTIATVIGVLAVLFVILYVTGVVEVIYNRFFGINWRDDPSYTFRMDTIGIAVRYIFKRGIGGFLFGIGAGKAYHILEIETWLIEKYKSLPAIDNSYSTMILEQGIFAFIMYFGESLYSFKKVLQMNYEEKTPRNNKPEWIYYLLLPLLTMTFIFDFQGWPGAYFVIMVLIGIDMSAVRGEDK
ncbi:O-antigen ligase family protein [Butyrivibrio sp. WCE2006]|uniref:O-antigen ligase family protein n=1 Tax=Butyrivibrio sp. WCE2006 TaxID=1410611 RepID=UPI0005D24F96|nr:O-antigen ligase family protein [Butyrivibrio sp. WCE2006]